GPTLPETAGLRTIPLSRPGKAPAPAQPDSPGRNPPPTTSLPTPPLGEMTTPKTTRRPPRRQKARFIETTEIFHPDRPSQSRLARRPIPTQPIPLLNMSTWSRFKTHYPLIAELGLSLDISRIPFPDDFLARMEPAMQKAFADMAALEGGA